mmetsp:Transcript_14105/g.37862  ORF Transcript_14105/g.37862 Transcript_14105/m.37862 type:complete len:224 (-) Transcript_14105:136-807(-)
MRLVQICAVRNVSVISRLERLTELLGGRAGVDCAELLHHLVLHVVAMCLLHALKLLHRLHERARNTLMLADPHFALRHGIRSLLQKRFVLVRNPLQPLSHRLRLLVRALNQRGALLPHAIGLRLLVVLAQQLRILLNLLHRSVQRVDLAVKLVQRRVFRIAARRSALLSLRPARPSAANAAAASRLKILILKIIAQARPQIRQPVRHPVPSPHQPSHLFSLSL